jgi:hypothetical protein
LGIETPTYTHRLTVSEITNSGPSTRHQSYGTKVKANKETSVRLVLRPFGQRLVTDLPHVNP